MNPQDWIDITRVGSMFEEQMMAVGPRDPRRGYRHRPRQLTPQTPRADWEAGLAPNNPFWPDRDKDKP